VELREAAFAVAVAAGDTSAAAAPMAKPADTTWEPVDVPKPVYVEAAKAERPAPQPLDLPEAPKAAGKPSLKQGTPAAIPAAPPAKPLTKAQSALSNLDDVLQRRRA
jgi:glyoxylate carboligase